MELDYYVTYLGGGGLCPFFTVELVQVKEDCGGEGLAGGWVF